MKRLMILFSLVMLLAACSNDNFSDDYSAYKNMDSQQILQKAEHHLATKSYDDAVKDLSALDALFPFGPYAEQGLLDSIYAYYQDSQPALAMASAQRYIRLYPQSTHVDYALYMQGIINFNQGMSWLQKKFKVQPDTLNTDNNKKAFSAFMSLVRTYPRSVYAADALARLRYLRNMFAKHEMLIAQYYFKRHAYVAAANRAAYVVEHFNGVPQVKNALQLQVQCYRILGLNELASHAAILLRTTFSQQKTTSNKA